MTEEENIALYNLLTKQIEDLKNSVINRKTKQLIKDTILAQKLTLQHYKSNKASIPQSWSINEQRAYINGLENVLALIIEQEKNK